MDFEIQSLAPLESVYSKRRGVGTSQESRCFWRDLSRIATNAGEGCPITSKNESWMFRYGVVLRVNARVRLEVHPDDHRNRAIHLRL